GTAILPDSTCEECAKITGQVEQKVLRGQMQAVRVYRALKSRTKYKRAPKQYPLTIVKDGVEQQVELAIEDYPILLHFPLFTPPSYLVPGSKGIGLIGVSTVSFGPDPKAVAKRLGADHIANPSQQEPAAFARMIAKIGFAWAAAEGKLGLLENPPLVVPAILGHTDDIGRWVGTITEPIQKHPGHLHRILISEDRDRKVLMAGVQLLSDSGTPMYGVVLGQLLSQ
ncbi:MAG: hypothetical protein ACXVJL_13855, partial [Candidatus Angelobacter sp.]